MRAQGKVREGEGINERAVTFQADKSFAEPHKKIAYILYQTKPAYFPRKSHEYVGYNGVGGRWGCNDRGADKRLMNISVIIGVM